MYPIRNSESTARLDSPFSDQEAESFLHGEKVDNLQYFGLLQTLYLQVFWRYPSSKVGKLAAMTLMKPASEQNYVSFLP
jgi:hypothetical protein